MKRKVWLVLGIFVAIIILLASCEYKQIQPVDKEKSEDYFVFGHTQAFCMNCDVQQISDLRRRCFCRWRYAQRTKPGGVGDQ